MSAAQQVRFGQLCAPKRPDTLAAAAAGACACRAHVGGLLGGAAVSWLLGPALVQGQDGIVRDEPPVPIWVHKQLPPRMPGLGVQPT